MNTAAVTGVSVALPGVTSPQGLLGPAVPGAAPVDPAAVIGKKGLRYKDRATQIGLCLAFSALDDAGLLDGTGLTAPGDRIGVVVSSNLGNADTVCRAVETIAKETTSGLSPMDTPNASSNIIASETAIRYGLRGPNLTVCNGATSGLDAVRWAQLMVRSGRAEHMVVIGVEPDNPVTRRLVDGPVADGGAALVVSRSGAAGPTAAVKALLGAQVRTARTAAAVARLTETAPGATLWLTGEPDIAPPGEQRYGLTGWGELSGALGVVQCAAATAWFADGHEGPAYALADGAGAALLAPERSS
ncbi:3-oxoacyl-ACP synthase [Streptomyces sp. BG9H]|uniref:3-oxoacyl-ACP synthase n=1 Tax=Streptomyces anatolicus TaxID=2675858 RepID=A0ABS6YHQ1_9ACTN|nr:beta-ketoacyl synthase N-terminal-like domain-containing protein [Streptomyces anatolicus]MBW5420645.1 3-oxoacyl-ACP synthase [Streptomyces anatolicus]